MSKTKILFKNKEYSKGGDVSTDMCYANYRGYDLQSTRCEEEGVDFIMLGEYRDVARDLRKDYTSDWIYYNRMARIYIDIDTALKFVKEANAHFKSTLTIHPFFYDIDRSFATYYVQGSKPEYPIPIDVGGMVRTDTKPKTDIKEIKTEVRKMADRLERREKQKPPIILSRQWKEVNGKYWWIGMVVNDGGADGYFDREWKNKRANKHLPVDNGISLFTLIHEYAHCLDYVNSIEEKRFYEVPVGELELTTGTDFVGNALSKEKLKSLAERKRRGETRTNLLATHGEYFVKSLANICEAGRKGEIPILNKLELEVSKLEKEIGGSAYAQKQRDSIRVSYMDAMKRKIAVQDTPYLRIELPEQFKEYLSASEMSYVSKLPKTQINVDIALDLLPYVAEYEHYIEERLYIRPQEFAKILDKMKSVKTDLMRLIRRLGND